MSNQAMTMMTDMAMQSARHNNMDTERNRLANISNSTDQALKEKELRKAAEGFEAIFIQKMWDEMRSSLPKNGLHYSKEEEYWQSMYSQELGKSMASSGGIGLADMMVEQLTRPCMSAPQTGALSRIRMVVEPAPLVPQKAEVQNTQTNQAQQNSQAAQQQNQQITQQNAVQSAAQNTVQNTAVLYEAYNQQEENTQNQQVEQNQQQAQQQVQQEQAAENIAPQYVRTTYVTNLPPEERQHAILDKKGEPVRKTQASGRAPINQIQANQNQTRQIQLPTQNDYIDRGLSIPRSVDVADNVPEYNPVQSMQQPVNSLTAQNAVPMASNELTNDTANASLNGPTDILSGITTTYIPYAKRMEMIMASQRVQQTQMAQGEVLQNQVLLAENNGQDTASVSSPSSVGTEQIRIPSLEQALRLGTLVASLNPDEINQVQVRQMLLAENSNTVIGGGTILTSPLEQANRPEFVSALAPQSEFALPVDGTISSGFGWRMDPINHKRAWHTGIDIRANAGTNVTASREGVVRFAGQDEELGNMIVIDHGNGIESVYGHNAELLVKAGDTVNSGTQIATIGSSGRTNGSHLHFEIRQNGLSINPEPYFAGNTEEKNASQAINMV